MAFPCSSGELHHYPRFLQVSGEIALRRIASPCDELFPLVAAVSCRRGIVMAWFDWDARTPNASASSVIFRPAKPFFIQKWYMTICAFLNPSSMDSFPSGYVQRPAWLDGGVDAVAFSTVARPAPVLIQTAFYSITCCYGTGPGWRRDLSHDGPDMTEHAASFPYLSCMLLSRSWVARPPLLKNEQKFLSGRCPWWPQVSPGPGHLHLCDLRQGSGRPQFVEKIRVGQTFGSPTLWRRRPECPCCCSPDRHLTGCLTCGNG